MDPWTTLDEMHPCLVCSLEIFLLAQTHTRAADRLLDTATKTVGNNVAADMLGAVFIGPFFEEGRGACLFVDCLIDTHLYVVCSACYTLYRGTFGL